LANRPESRPAYRANHARRDLTISIVFLIESKGKPTERAPGASASQIAALKGICTSASTQAGMVMNPGFFAALRSGRA
jgi:hypothetical protein